MAFEQNRPLVSISCKLPHKPLRVVLADGNWIGESDHWRQREGDVIVTYWNPADGPHVLPDLTRCLATWDAAQ